MKQKTSITIIAVIFLIGIVAGVGADRIISNTDEIYIENFIAGSEVQANFSYDYIKGLEENTEDSPAILDLTIISNSTDYPVWKGDFEIDGFIQRYWWLGFVKTIPFSCSETSPQTITYSIGSATVYPTNGTFYCYNEYGNLELDRHDDVFLNIKSHPALWPGQYNLIAQLYYLQKEYINVEVTPIVYHVPDGENTSVEFNISFEISGGNAVRMKMSDLFEGYVSEGISFTIGGTNYTAEELNASLIYNGTDYPVGNEYEDWTKEPIIFPTDNDRIARGTAVFMMDIKDHMAAGNYHGTYQFDVTQED